MHIPISFFQFLSVVLGGIFWFGGLVLLGGLQNFGFVLVATFFARDWNLHIIDSHVVGAIVGVSRSWMLHGMSGFV